MIKINLVPAELLIQQRQQQQLMQAAAAGILVLFVFFGISVGHWNTARRLDKQYADDEAKMKKLQVIVDQVDQLEATARAVQSRLNAIENLLKGRFLYTKFLQDWAEAVPAGVWVLNLNTSSSEDKVTVSTSAMARTKEDVADWVRTLETSGKFSGVELGPLSESADGTSYSFTVRCQYQFTPTPEMAGAK